MTNEEIRIAVAEEMGWHEDTEHTMGETIKVWRNAKYPFCSSLPNYPNSLDACAEFEKTVTLQERDVYLDHLYMVTDRGRMATRLWLGVTAKPIQRCEAFLRMRGKWKEDMD